ncbi:MAG: hypothetical protein J0M08_07650 [Bacteroidetes bacterium]|nr:hypothetical protein [Bacteroidota bacterium]
MIYRFRVVFEDYEDVVREIDIKSSQTFKDLHTSIQESVGFDNKHNASFFQSTDLWKKGTEVILTAEKEADKSKKLMSTTKLASLIDDPHQKFIYLYDFSFGWTFYIELLKIIEIDAKATYPKISKSVGVAPKQYKNNTPPPVVDEEDDELHEKKNHKEKIFNEEEAYDTDDASEDDDVLTEGDDEETADGEEEAGGEFSDTESESDYAE